MTITKEIDRGDVRITLELHGKEMGNTDDHFAVTCVGPGFAGSAHEEIEKLAPELQPLIALHLCDTNGVPMHARANGWYFYSGEARKYELERPEMYREQLKQSDRERAARALHIAPDDLPAGFSREQFEQFCDVLEQSVWKPRAIAGLELLESIEGVDPDTPRPGSVEAFAEEHGVSVTDYRHRGTGSHGADEWTVSLSCETRTVSVEYSKGSAYAGEEPNAGEVLEALKMDASAYETTDGDPEEIAAHFGYDIEEAADIGRQLREQAAKLDTLLGADLRRELLEIES